MERNEKKKKTFFGLMSGRLSQTGCKYSQKQEETHLRRTKRRGNDTLLWVDYQMHLFLSIQYILHYVRRTITVFIC